MKGGAYTHRLQMAADGGAHPYNVLIVIANEKCHLHFGLWQAVSK